MIVKRISRYDQFLNKLDRVAYWAQRLSIVMMLAGLVMFLLAPNGAAYADGDDPLGEAAGTMFAIFKSLGMTFIRIAYALMFLIFAVGSVKSGLGAQAAQQFGATGRASFEMLNLAGGVVIFVFGLMTLPIVNMIIDNVSEHLFSADGGFSFDIRIPGHLPGGN